MDAVSVPKDPSGVVLVSVAHESADQMDSSSSPRLILIRGMQGIGKTRIASALASRRLRPLLDATTTTKEVRDFLDALDEQADVEAPLVLHAVGHGSATTTLPLDFASGNLLAHRKEHHLQTCSTADLPENDSLVASSATVSTESYTHWRALPCYTNRPFVAHSCCGASALTPEAVNVAQNRKVSVLSVASRATLFHTFLHMQMREAVAPLTVIIRDKQIAQDYRQGLRQFLDGILDVLGYMVVMVLAAMSHQAQAPTFLLVMLATARRYGRRGDGDDHLLPAPVLRSKKQSGAACPAT